MEREHLCREMLELYLTMLRLHRRLGKQGRAQPSCRPLPATHVGVLLLLSSRESMSMSALAKLLMVSRQQLTGIIDTLTRRGQVERSVDPQNRRVVRAVLTPQGRETARELDQALARSVPGDRKRSEELARALTTVRELLDVPTT